MRKFIGIATITIFLAYSSPNGIFAQGYTGRSDYERKVLKDATTKDPYLECLGLFYKEDYERETLKCLDELLKSEPWNKKAKFLREETERKKKLWEKILERRMGA